jgi:hypothetical protein
MITNEVNNEISVAVRGGFFDRERIIRIFLEEMYSPGDLNESDVIECVDEKIRILEVEKATWPSVTDCDRLNMVFNELNNMSIIALQNAGFTQSDGYEDSMSTYKMRDDKAEIIGYCFYHGQDLDRVVSTGDLYIAFGPINPELEETDGSRIGKIVTDKLLEHGFMVEWNGSFNKRICVHNIIWQRR